MISFITKCWYFIAKYFKKTEFSKLSSNENKDDNLIIIESIRAGESNRLNEAVEPPIVYEHLRKIEDAWSEYSYSITELFAPATIEQCELYANKYVENGIIPEKEKDNIIKTWLHSEIPYSDLKEKSELAFKIWDSKYKI